MNRRSFFKIVTGFLAGIFLPKAKAEEWHFVVARYNGKGNSDSIDIYGKNCSTGIDPNSEWARQKPLTLAELEKIKKEIDTQRECNLRDYPVEFTLGSDFYAIFT